MLAVFSWGLRYKLSLYQAASAQQAPAAKVLSERERPASVTQMHVVFANEQAPAKRVLPAVAVITPRTSVVAPASIYSPVKFSRTTAVLRFSESGIAPRGPPALI
jgi:hypothetical protein